MKKVTGQFRIALLPSTDPQAFEEHMKNTVFKGPALQLSRITRSFSHTLLQGSMRQYGRGIQGPAPLRPGAQAARVAGLSLAAATAARTPDPLCEPNRAGEAL